MSHAQSAQRDLMIKTLWKIIFQYKRTYVDSVERRTHAFRNSFIIFHPELIFFNINSKCIVVCILYCSLF